MPDRSYLFWLVFLCVSLWCLSWYTTSSPAAPTLDYWTPPPTVSPNYIVVTSNNASEWPPYQMDELAPWDFNSLIDLEDFNFIETSPNCAELSSTPPLLLVVIHSAPNNIDKRNTIRETWGTKTLGDEHVVLRFMLGKVDSQEIQEILDSESRRYNDIVQGSFMDAYRNLTYKHVMSLKWVSYFCPTAKYILKTDDDVLVNMPLLLRFLINDLSPAGVRRLILCPINKGSLPKRSYRSKWRVSWKDYSGQYYPPYCLGYVVLYSPDVVFRLYIEAQRSEYFWIDDVHITGTLLKRANLEHTELTSLILTQAQVQAIINGWNFRPDSFLFGNPNMDVNSIRKLWARLKEVSNTSWPPP